MKKWLVVIGIVFTAEVIAEAAHLVTKHVFLSEVSRVSIIAFIALFLSAAILVFREA